MALSPDKLQFLITQLSKSELASFSGFAAQIFSYLDQEVKDNPIFDFTSFPVFSSTGNPIYSKLLFNDELEGCSSYC